MTRKRDMVARFKQSPLLRGQSCLLVWLPLLVASVVSDASETKTLNPFPTPFRSSSDPPWRLHIPPLGHINHVLSWSDADRGNHQFNGDDVPHEEILKKVRTKHNEVPIPNVKCVSQIRGKYLVKPRLGRHLGYISLHFSTTVGDCSDQLHD